MEVWENGGMGEWKYGRMHVFSTQRYQRLKTEVAELVSDVEQIKDGQQNSEKMLQVSPVDLAQDVRGILILGWEWLGMAQDVRGILILGWEWLGMAQDVRGILILGWEWLGWRQLLSIKCITFLLCGYSPFVSLCV